MTPMTYRLKKFFSTLEKIVGSVEKLSNLCGSWLIIFLMGLIVSDVSYRTIARRSILGAYTLAEIIMVGICFFSMAYTQNQRGHVRMDFLVNRLKKKSSDFAELMASVLSLVICVLIFYQSVVEAKVAIDIRLVTSGIMEWPAWPLKIIVAFGFLLLSIRIAIQLTQQIHLIVPEKKDRAN